MPDPQPSDTLNTDGSLPGSAPPFVPPLPSADAAGLDLRDYELLEPLGQGGMGEVYRCSDPALGRDLAIKILTGRLRGHPQHEQRFLREARITGSLQHPGIVPIHNLGRLHDGRLHYTMRLVRGRTFAEILREEAGQSELLPSLLAIFEKICQAVAYAHSKRVIHRDLKPANVMVGKFGEVQVMDWGLAKLLPEGERSRVSAPSAPEPAGTLIYTEAEDAPSDLTRAGSGLGTPAYLSPEQALGELEAVDERTDVFALGCILCEILTGQPPYHGRDGNEVLRQARRGELSSALAQLEQCPADEALKVLCRDCLAVDVEQRPRHAGMVAQRVADYSADVQERLRQAQLERVAAETRASEEQARAALEAERAKTERRARHRMLALFLAIATILCLAIGGGWWIARERIARLQAEARGNEARNLYLRGQVLNSKGRLDDGIAEFRRALDLQPDNIEYWSTLAEAFYDAQRWDDAIAAYQAMIRLKPDYAVVHNYLGDALLKKGSTDRALQAYREAIRLEPDYSTAHSNLAACLYNKDRYAEAVPEYQEIVRLNPKSANCRADLGLVLQKLGRWNEALAACREAIRLQPDYAPAHNVLGLVLENKGDLPAALAAYREAVRLQPSLAAAHTNLGNILFYMGRGNEAVAEHKEAIRLQPDLAVAHFNLAWVLLPRGAYAKAKEQARAALHLAPGNSEYQKYVEKCEKYLALKSRLPAILQGQPLPTDP